jgi:hypothetical protein
MNAFLPRMIPHRALCAAWTALIVCSILAACGSKTEPQTAAQPAPDVAPGAAAPIVPAPAVTQASWAPDALEELLAPIALYPDVLLGQVLAASVNSQEVLDGGNWLLQNENLQGDALDAATEKAGFGPAMRALVHFPTVVDMMCQQIAWTRQLGSAFSSDQKSVLDAVQRLRARAAEVGNLKSTPEQTVETTTENDKVIVEVKPADPKVVYVPTYDPQTIYVESPGAVVADDDDDVDAGTAIAAGLFAFGVGVLIGNAMDDDYCYPHYGYGAVYVGPRPFYPPAYVYRPVYGPAFRPAYGYASPPGYRYNYNNINVNRNININNNNYYNRFSNNQNLKGGATRSPLANKPAVATRPAGTQGRVAQTPTANRAESWKGQSSYAGARKPEGTDRLDKAAGSRAGSHDLQTNRPAHVDRGYGESTRTASRPPPELDRAHQPSTGSRDSSRDIPSSVSTGSFDRSSQMSSRSSMPSQESAFSGASRQGSGSFDRASSARGHASAGSHQRAARSSGGRRR